MKKATNNLTYLFDGHCVLCSRAVQYVLRYEKQPTMRFVAILSKEGRALAKANDIDPEEPESFLIIEGDKVYRSSDAVFVLLRHVGGPAKVFLIGKLFPKAFRNWFYERIAKNRYKVFGRTDSCYVPSPENRDRFVLT